MLTRLTGVRAWHTATGNARRMLIESEVKKSRDREGALEFLRSCIYEFHSTWQISFDEVHHDTTTHDDIGPNFKVLITNGLVKKLERLTTP